MAKSWVNARNIYGVLTWIKTINKLAEDGHITEIRFGNKPYGCKWNTSCWLNITPWEITITHKSSSLYWGVKLEVNGKNREHVYKALKQLVYKLPIIIEGKEIIYTYKKYKSKVKLIEEKLNYDPNRKTS